MKTKYLYLNLSGIKKMAIVKYWLYKFIFQFLYFFNDLIFSLWNGGKGQVVSPIKNSLLLKSATQIAQEIRKGKLKSEEVVQAYINRIQEVNPLINAIVHNSFDEALKKAKEVDRLIQSGICTAEQLEKEKPLLGVPLTIKHNFKIKGFPDTQGSKLYRDDIAQEDAESVTLLKKAGGIILGSTNIPEFCGAIETNNCLYGRTCNPYGTNLTPGGSSGGESAIISSGASVCGLGNDVIGSLRIPAHFTGIYSHKPTHDFISNVGGKIQDSALDHYFHTGPMCRYSEDLELLTKVLTKEHPEHYKLYREINFKQLRIFYITGIDDPMLHPVDQEMSQAILDAVAYFKGTYGVQATELKIPLIEKSSLTGYHVITNAHDFFLYVTKGKIEKMNFTLDMLKYFVGKSTLSFFMAFWFRCLESPIFSKKHLEPYFKKLEKHFCDEFSKLLEKENSVLFYPTYPVTAYHHYSSIPYYQNHTYCSIFNITGQPATVRPVGINQKSKLPQSIQIVAGKYNDSLTIACAIELDQLFHGWIEPGKVK